MKKDCPKYANWHVKKGTLLNFVYSEVNLASIPKHTWWINTGASMSMQGCLRSRLSTDSKRFIYVGNNNVTLVEAIGLFRLQLKTSILFGFR